jgi:hypothetical protein
MSLSVLAKTSVLIVAVGESEAGAPEIEITPAMVEAGVLAYYRHSDFNERIEDVVTTICRVMLAAKPADGGRMGCLPSPDPSSVSEPTL